MPKLSTEDSARLIGHLQAVLTPSEVAKIFGVNKTTVYQLKEKFENDGTLA